MLLVSGFVSGFFLFYPTDAAQATMRAPGQMQQSPIIIKDYIDYRNFEESGMLFDISKNEDFDVIDYLKTYEQKHKKTVDFETLFGSDNALFSQATDLFSGENKMPMRMLMVSSTFVAAYFGLQNL